jgi:hypothetical protein
MKKERYRKISISMSFMANASALEYVPLNIIIQKLLMGMMYIGIDLK